MIPRSLNWPVDPFLTGGIVLAIGCLVGVLGARIKSSNEERHRAHLYVKRRRGEETAPPEPPKIARALQYLGAAVAFVGVVVLVAAWSSAAGQA